MHAEGHPILADAHSGCRGHGVCMQSGCNAQARSCPAIQALLGHPLTPANFLCVNGETSCYSILRGHARPASCFP